MEKSEIKRIRLAACMTQAELAKYLGYGAYTRVSELESGRRKPGRAVIKLLELLRK